MLRAVLLAVIYRHTRNKYNKAIVDSRLRPQSCCHLANFIEMQEIVDCKLDANNE